MKTNKTISLKPETVEMTYALMESKETFSEIIQELLDKENKKRQKKGK